MVANLRCTSPLHSAGSLTKGKNKKTEDFDDEALIESANWLHRKFILMIDYSERQLNYHSRFVTYLTNASSQHGLCIRPTTFERDLLQERDAMVVVCSRFLALRT
jgi:hypothetical protein